MASASERRECSRLVPECWCKFVIREKLLIGIGVSDFETSARHYTSSKRGNTQVQQMRAVEELLQELIRHSDAWPFLKPVDKKLVPGSWLSLLFLVRPDQAVCLG